MTQPGPFELVGQGAIRRSLFLDFFDAPIGHFLRVGDRLFVYEGFVVVLFAFVLDAD